MSTICDDARRLLRQQGKLPTRQEPITAHDDLCRDGQRLLHTQQQTLERTVSAAMITGLAGDPLPNPIISRANALIARAQHTGITLARCERHAHKCQTPSCTANAAWCITTGVPFPESGTGRRYACNRHFEEVTERMMKGTRR
jgi:hypothetical protein